LTTSNVKEVIFVFEQTGAKGFLDSALSVSNKENIVIVCANDEISQNLSELGYQCRSIGSYSRASDAELQNAVEWMKTWPDKSILNGKSFKELLVYEGVSIYWFLQTRLYLHRVRDLLFLIEHIKHVLEEEMPVRVWIKGNEEVRYIISSMYGAQDIAGFEQLEKEKDQSKISFRSYQGYPTLKILLLKILRGTFTASIQSRKGTKGKILVVTEVSNWRREFDYALQRYLTRDVFFHDIVSKLSAQGYDVTVVDFENRPNKLLKTYAINKERNASFGVPVKPWEKYLTFEIIRRGRGARDSFVSLWNQLRHSEEFLKSLTYRNVSIYELVRKDIDDLLKSLKAFAAVTFIDASKRIIEKEKPDVVIMHDEYGALQLSLINAAREKGIPTVSIQHGLVSEEQIAYVHEPEHISGKRKELLFPIPDTICVWSEGAKQKLMEIAKFPPSVPIVTGDPKTDFLPEAIKVLNGEKITKTLSIPKGKKIIMFATENLQSLDEKSIIAKNVFDAIKALPDCHLIVKMHPNETDTAFYERALSEANLSNYTIIRDFNLYDLLYISNLIILSYSTVAVEAMRMKKPVVSLDLMHLHGSVSFIKNRKAIVVNEANELLPAIQKCLDNDAEVQEIIEAGRIFADQELGVADGKAGERIVKLIVQLVQGQGGPSTGAMLNIGN